VSWSYLIKYFTLTNAFHLFVLALLLSVFSSERDWVRLRCVKEIIRMCLIDFEIIIMFVGFLTPKSWLSHVYVTDLTPFSSGLQLYASFHNSNIMCLMDTFIILDKNTKQQPPTPPPTPHTHTHTHTLSLSLTHTHTHTHTLSLSHTHTHTQHNTHTTHTHSHTHTRAHTHTFTHTRNTHTHRRWLGVMHQPNHQCTEFAHLLTIILRGFETTVAVFISRGYPLIRT
jgi:hypothetical protein